MQHLEGSGTPVLYIGRTVLKGQTHSKIKNVRDLYRRISDLKKGYQPRTNIAKDEKHDLATDCHNILTRRRNWFSQLLSVRGVSDVRQTELHTTEPPVAEPIAIQVETAIEKLKRHKSPDIDKIPAQLINVLKPSGFFMYCQV